MTKQADITDKVSDDHEAALEIGFDRARHGNMSAILFDNLKRNPHAIAVYADTGNVTYRELCADAARAGHAFDNLGLERGERIVMVLDDREAYLAAFFGAVRAGFVPVLVNILSPPDQIGYFLEDSQSPVLLCEASLLPGLKQVIAAAKHLKQVVAVGGEAPVGGADTTGWSDFIIDQPTELDAADTGPDDMAFWMYSSGSTGRPKGIVHLHHDAAYTEQSYAAHYLKLKPGDITYSVPKIFFAYGFGNSVTFPLSAGAGVVLATGRPDPGSVFDQIERFRPSVFFGLPTLYNALIAADGASKRDLSSIRLCLSAAEVLPAETFQIWLSDYGLEIVEGLGSTELLHIYLSNPPGRTRLASAGQAVPGYEISLRDKDGKQVSGDKDGIMWVRGHSSSPTYWNRPDDTADTMRGDWLYTGDRFRVDEDGYYYFLGRADDLIKVSGQWIYPLEIETCLGDHEAVVECAVMGVKQANGLMTTKAFVEVRPGIETGPGLVKNMQEFVKRRLLPFKYPRHVTFVEQMPKTGTDKVDRQKLLAAHYQAQKT
jgi:benzoate-CoA ligase family protein